MALPVTIAGVWPDDGNSNIGPFISSGGNVYAIVQNSATSTSIRAYKATDPTVSFAEQDSGNRPTTASGVGARVIAVYQDGDLLHVGFGGVGTSVGVSYAQFSMATDAWIVSGFGFSGGNPEVVLFTHTDDATIMGIDISVRSDGDIIVAYHGENPATMGGNFQEIAYSRWEGTSWTNGVVVASTSAKNDNFHSPKIVMGSSDQCHITYVRDTDRDLRLRALSSGNTLRTERRNNGGNIDSMQGRGTYTRASTEKIVLMVYELGLNNERIDYTHFTDDTNPTFDQDILHSDVIAVSARERSFGFAVDVDDADQPNYHGYGPGSTATTVRLMTDSGGETWSQEAADITTGTPTAVDAISANIFERDGNFVYAFVIDDSGTVRYDEYVIRTSSISQAIALAAETDSAGAIGIVLGVNLAAETDSAFVITPVVAGVEVAISTALETDSALALGLGLELGITGALEADAGLGLGLGLGLGIAAETDSAFAITFSEALAISPAAETDAALGLGLALGISLAPETDAGFGLGLGLGIGLAAETDAAQALGLGLEIGLALETDAAFVVVPLAAQELAIGTTLETDAALALGLGLGLGTSAETDAAQALGLGLEIGLASETDFAFVVVPESAQELAIATALESDAALPLALALGISPALEADAALAVAFSEALAVTLASEADSAAALGLGLGIAAASEADSALALALGLGVIGAPETDSAPGLGLALGLGMAAEADAALALGLCLGINLAIETDSAFVVVPSQGAQALPISTALETDAALALGLGLGLSPAAETDAALGLGLGLGITGALEVDAGFSLGLGLEIGLGLETDLALAIIATGGTPDLPVQYSLDGLWTNRSALGAWHGRVVEGTWNERAIKGRWVSEED